ncbi:hypothetical protein [Dactylosporangium maewongense]|uniref:hypothetical protein n=1 Tax=Dactylosporangium TaxID=35753 RepID=UPI0031D3C74C
MTDTQELTAVDAPPRQSYRWLSVTSAAFALAVVLGGTDLVAGASASDWRFLVILALAVAFLSFALVGAGLLSSGANQPAIAGIGVAALGIALLVSWLVPDGLPGPALPGSVQIRTSNESICGEITSSDHEFVAIDERIGDEPNGQRARIFARRLIPVAAIESITGVSRC